MFNMIQQSYQPLSDLKIKMNAVARAIIQFCRKTKRTVENYLIEDQRESISKTIEMDAYTSEQTSDAIASLWWAIKKTLQVTRSNYRTQHKSFIKPYVSNTSKFGWYKGVYLDKV